MKVTQKDIEATIENGASSFRDIHLATKLGGKCGACIDHAKELITALCEDRSKLEP